LNNSLRERSDRKQEAGGNKKKRGENFFHARKIEVKLMIYYEIRMELICVQMALFIS
jgi:hypothetical protein